jgi:hypothetical protein
MGQDQQNWARMPPSAAGSHLGSCASLAVWMSHSGRFFWALQVRLIKDCQWLPAARNNIPSTNYAFYVRGYKGNKGSNRNLVVSN